jgi:hypothetical protein
MMRGQNKQCGGREVPCRSGDVAEKADCGVEREGAAEQPQPRLLRAGAGDEEVGRRELPPDQRERLEEEVESLLSGESSNGE